MGCGGVRVGLAGGVLVGSAGGECWWGVLVAIRSETLHRPVVSRWLFLRAYRALGTGLV